MTPDDPAQTGKPTPWPPQEPCESPEPSHEDSAPPPLPLIEAQRPAEMAYQRARRRIIAVLVVAVVAIATIAVLWPVTRRLPLEDARELALHYGKTTGLDPALVLAVIQAESAGDRRAVSRAGARGLMQLMYPTAQDMAKKAGLALRGPEQLFDPDLNVRLGTRYLALMRQMFQDDAFLYIAAYNAGPGRMARLRRENPTLASWELVALKAPSETRTYVRRVLRYWDEFREELAAGAARPRNIRP